MRYLVGYLRASAVYGFVRGWKADYVYNRYDEEKPIRPIEYSLGTEKYAQKLVRGCINASLYGSVGNPPALYRLMSRIEITLTGKNPYILVYTEPLGYTTMECKSSFRQPELHEE